MTSIEKLDKILSIIINHGGRDDTKQHFISHTELFKKYVFNKLDITSKELTEICIYLIDDKAIYREEQDEKEFDKPEPLYFSTLKGRMIYEDEGYAKIFKNKDIEQQRVINLEKRSVRHSYYMAFLTLILTFTAIQSALEIIRNYYNPLFPFAITYVVPFLCVALVPVSLLRFLLLLLNKRK